MFSSEPVSDSSEAGARFRFSASPSLCPSLAHALSLPQKQINIKKNNNVRNSLSGRRKYGSTQRNGEHCKWKFFKCLTHYISRYLLNRRNMYIHTKTYRIVHSNFLVILPNCKVSNVHQQASG